MPSRSKVTDPAIAFLGRLRHRLTNCRPIWPSLVRGIAAGTTCIAIVIILRVFVAHNLHTVVPRRAFRAAQMNPDRLQTVVRDKGIRTVVNLRGYCPDFDWYRGESRAAHAANVNLEDVTLSAIRLPTPSEIRRLVDVLDHCEYPVLMHCRQGVDRTGLAAAVVMLLQPGESLRAAERQLRLAYGYVPYNGTENMRRFLDLYREWLRKLRLQHSPALFRQWAAREYCPGACRAEIEPLDWPREPNPWPPNQGRTLHVRSVEQINSELDISSRRQPRDSCPLRDFRLQWRGDLARAGRTPRCNRAAAGIDRPEIGNSAVARRPVCAHNRSD